MAKENKKSPECCMTDETKADCMARKMPEIMKDNPNMSDTECTAMAEKMCSQVCDTGKSFKAINKKIDADLSVEVKDLGENEVETVVSSDFVDRYGEVIDIKGLDISKYLQNPVVQWAHDYSLPPIAKATKVWKYGNQLMARMKFAVDENPLAKTIHDLILGGFLNAVSIGFIALEMDGNTYTKSEMLEFSVVPVPANPEALIYAKKKGLDIGLLKKYNIINMTAEEIKAQELKTAEEAKLKAEAEAKKIADTKAAEEAKIKADADFKKEMLDIAKGLQTEIATLKDPVKLKNININKKFLNDKGEVGKEMKFMLYVRGIFNKDMSEYLHVVGKDAMNATDDLVVLPPAEFIAELQRLEEKVGVGLQYATVRRSTTGLGLKYVHGDSDLEIFDTAEGGMKKSTKLSYKEITLAWRKFAGILPITDELSEDAAFDLWNDATKRFARAFAKKSDQLIFTETSIGGVTKNGILQETGTKTITLSGDSMKDIAYNDLVDMVYGVPTMSETNGRFYFNREVLPLIMELKDDIKRPLWLAAMADGTPATILGKQYSLVEVMPKLSEDAADLPFICFGDLQYVTLGLRTDLTLKTFDAGVVGDPDEEDQETNTINLLTQDVQVLRAVQRMNAVVRYPAAFSVGKTKATS